MDSSSSSSSSSSNSCKRRRPPATASNQLPTCLVDGCLADLSKSRDYHRRRKVCQLHSKTPMVSIRGHLMRFCQQCSRFHPLVEFDEGKRSCRERLDGHNRRRRKPQPSILPSTSTTLLGARGYLQFGSPQTCLSHNSSQMGFIKENQMFLELPSQTHEGENRFQWPQGFADPSPARSLLSPSQRARKSQVVNASHVAQHEPLVLDRLIFPGLQSHHLYYGPGTMEGNFSNAKNDPGGSYMLNNYKHVYDDGSSSLSELYHKDISFS